jgi:hypothetical protein
VLQIARDKVVSNNINVSTVDSPRLAAISLIASLLMYNLPAADSKRRWLGPSSLQLTVNRPVHEQSDL